jgi:hypothetical protein
MKTETTRRAVMAGLAAAPVAGLPAIAGGDAQLLGLGKQLEAAWAHQNCAYSLIPDSDDNAVVEVAEQVANEAAARAGEIVDTIIETKATTFEGLKIKARALSWCHCGGFDGIAETVGNIWWDDDGKVVKDKPTTDRLIADSILFDLIALAAMDREPQS